MSTPVALDDVLTGDVPRLLGLLCDWMEVAEEEIDRAMVENTESAEEVYAAFKLLRPHAVLLAHVGVETYRAHCREVLRRVVETGSPPRATNAEIAACMAGLSLAAPLNRKARCLYHTAFDEVLPGAVEVTDVWTEWDLHQAREFREEVERWIEKTRG